ncbi:MAG TPA: NAD(P)/FAD-dependent oxidoreductase [Ignavibacteria bacterium]|nr:NAD(P)/FAD-dependent oxidoreductase [Ignavibacteria bacterium]
MSANKTINVVGAGPGGLTAAIVLAKNGYDVNLYEKNINAGLRFNGDFQGLENWSDDEDTLNILNRLGIKINFLCHPYSGDDGYFIGPDRKKVYVKTSRPLFYLIERGSGEHSLDQGLSRQAEELGVNILWKHKLDSLEDGYAIVGTGPKAADAIAKGIVFKTSHNNIYVGFVDNRIAPKAYAYLLVNNGRATFATCMFKDYKNEKIYFKRALQVLNSSVDIDIIDAKEFGGFVNFFNEPIMSKNNRIFYVGENAGFQDALWGFGIKYAMLSGYYAAKSIIDNQAYPELCKTYLYPKLRTSLANRWLYSHLYNPGYIFLFRYMANLDDVIPPLRKHYNISFFKKLIYKIAKGWYHTKLIDKQCMHVHCNCVWCRHGKLEHAAVENC